MSEGPDERVAGPGGPLGVAEARRGVLAATEEAERAALRPADPGGLPHPLRTALAARVARLHDAPDLARAYEEGAGEARPLADPATPGEGREAAICAFVDLAAARTAEAAAADVAALREAGVAEPDIVRLAGLVAFLAYRIRVAAGLRLLGDAVR